MPDLNDFQNMTDHEKTQAINNGIESVGAAAQNATTLFKSWVLRIAGGLGWFIGLLILLFGSKLLALVFLGLGTAAFGYGFGAMNRPAWKAIGGAGLALAGLGVLILGVHTFKKAQASVDWPAAPASITRSESENRTTTEWKDNVKRKVTYQVAIIEYNYAVNDQTYTSNKISLGGQKRGNTQKLLDKYPIHKQVQAYYNPENHHEAVLEPGVKEGNFFFPVFGILICVFGIYLGIRDFQAYLNTLS